MEPYPDPLGDLLDGVEQSIEASFGLPEPFPIFDGQTDAVGRILDSLEASIEGTVVPPANPVEMEPFVQPPSLPGPMSQGFFGSGPPRLPEPVERRWGDIKPPVAATPFFLPDGPKTPAYHPLGGSGTGISNTDEQDLTRWCPESNQPVNLESCQACSQWDDHGSGFQQCYHDWAEENEDKDHEKDKGHEDEF
jgi:hypothetical protein